MGIAMMIVNAIMEYCHALSPIMVLFISSLTVGLLITMKIGLVILVLWLMACGQARISNPEPSSTHDTKLE